MAQTVYIFILQLFIPIEMFKKISIRIWLMSLNCVHEKLICVHKFYQVTTDTQTNCQHHY